ncbi:MAG: DUF2634 domain-containing protein [Eubacterium sp.]|nr:DUF2634 domain-containing protein [Eubacterium sp.]
MSFFPEVSQIKESEEETSGYDFYFDGREHKLLSDGNLETEDYGGSIKEWIRKVCCTVRGAHEVYTKEEDLAFGLSIYEHLGERDLGYYLADMQREIETQLVRHPEIEEVKDFSFEKSLRKLTVYYTVVCSNGEELTGEVEI